MAEGAVEIVLAGTSRGLPTLIAGEDNGARTGFDRRSRGAAGIALAGVAAVRPPSMTAESSRTAGSASADARAAGGGGISSAGVAQGRGAGKIAGVGADAGDTMEGAGSLREATTIPATTEPSAKRTSAKARAPERRGALAFSRESPMVVESGGADRATAWGMTLGGPGIRSIERGRIEGGWACTPWTTIGTPKENR